LGYRGLVARVTDVPHLYTTLAASVDMTRGVTDGNSAHHLPVAQSIDLTSMAWDARPDQCIWGKRHRLHLSISTHMKGVSPEGTKGGKEEKVSEVKAKRLNAHFVHFLSRRRENIRLSSRNSRKVGRKSRDTNVVMRIKSYLKNLRECHS